MYQEHLNPLCYNSRYNILNTGDIILCSNQNHDYEFVGIIIKDIWWGKKTKGVFVLHYSNIKYDYIDCLNNKLNYGAIISEIALIINNYQYVHVKTLKGLKILNNDKILFEYLVKTVQNQQKKKCSWCWKSNKIYCNEFNSISLICYIYCSMNWSNINWVNSNINDIHNMNLLSPLYLTDNWNLK